MDAIHRDHITVCVCTFKRPHLLQRLLLELGRQQTEGRFSFSAVIVDNDVNRSARTVVEAMAASLSVPLRYEAEPQQNIALARNRAIENGQGEFLAFIDDDEFPTDRWLLELYLTFQKYRPTGVLGPVRPCFEPGAPHWLVASGLCNRRSFPTGSVLYWGHAVTGNVLFDRRLFEDPTNRFDSRYGRSGGEDGSFFEKVDKQGHHFVWCEEAAVYETVPPARWTARYYLRRAALIGGLTATKARRNLGKTLGYAFKSLLTLGVVVLLLPVSVLAGYHRFVRLAYKTAYHASRLLGCAGVVLFSERRD
jgi:glycosyltransferase involved in cell wall biosynthesis